MVKQLHVFEVEQNEDYSLVKCYEEVDGRNTIAPVKVSRKTFDVEKQKYIKDPERELKVDTFVEEHCGGDLKNLEGKDIDVYITEMQDGNLLYSLWEVGNFIRFDKVKDTNLTNGKIYSDGAIGEVDVDFDKGIRLGLTSSKLTRKEDNEPALLGKSIYFASYSQASGNWNVDAKKYKGFIARFKKATNIDISQFSTADGTLDFDRKDEIVEYLKDMPVKFMGKETGFGLSADMSINIADED